MIASCQSCPKFNAFEHLILGRQITSVRVIQFKVITGLTSTTALLQGNQVSHIICHGKQLAIVEFWRAALREQVLMAELMNNRKNQFEALASGLLQNNEEA